MQGRVHLLRWQDNTDYSNLLSGSYNAVADNAVVGVAIESGPAFSTSTTYNDFPSSLNFLSYYKGLLAKGYRVSPQMDQDNHYMSFGTANSNRLVALTSGRSREALMEALRSGRYYASQDCNVHVDYKNGGDVMGAQAVKAGLPQLSMNVTDPDGENVSTIELWGGAAGAAVPGSPLKTYTAVNTFSFGPADAQNLQPDNSSYYYFAIITQEDGNKIVTSPIYYTRSDATLPLQLMVFQARYNKDSNAVLLNWSTAAEVNTQSFVIERSVDGSAGWSAIGTVAAAGNRPGVAQYQFSDKSPVTGNNLYRLRMVDIDGKYTYSPVRNAAVGATNAYVYSVYPNPAPKYTYLNSTNVAPEKVTAQLLDGNGRIVRRQQYTVSSSAPAKVDLSGVSAGMYYMKVLSEKGVVTLKVLVRE
jgi:hypothetical protein